MLLKCVPDTYLNVHRILMVSDSMMYVLSCPHFPDEKTEALWSPARGPTELESALMVCTLLTVSQPPM